jgi:DNA-binding NarL/FixJ family response regulator
MKGSHFMATPVVEVNPVTPVQETPVTTHSAANSNAAAAVPQDTVTISVQAAPGVTKAPSIPSPAQTTTTSPSPSPAEAQQIQVLQSEGLTDSQIAEELNLSLGTVQQFTST